MTFQAGHRMTFEQRIHSFPPILVRLLARFPDGTPMSLEEIALNGDFTHYEAMAIASCTSWDGISVSDMIQFTAACRVDFCRGNCHTTDEYLRRQASRRNAFDDLIASDKENARLIAKWRRAYPEVPPITLWPPIRRLLVRLTPLLK